MFAHLSGGMKKLRGMVWLYVTGRDLCAITAGSIRRPGIPSNRFPGPAELSALVRPARHRLSQTPVAAAGV